MTFRENPQVLRILSTGEKTLMHESGSTGAKRDGLNEKTEQDRHLRLIRDKYRRLAPAEPLSVHLAGGATHWSEGQNQEVGTQRLFKREENSFAARSLCHLVFLAPSGVASGMAMNASVSRPLTLTYAL